MAETEQLDLTTLTVQLLSAYVANNSVASTDLAGLIQTTRAALTGQVEPDPVPAPEYVPAVTVRKSLASRDHLLSLIDGKPYKTLKRHLASHGLTPAEYRERYNLSKDYPIVAPAYSEMRREVSVRLGLGRRPETASPVTEPAVEAAPASAPVPKAKAAPKTSAAKKPSAAKVKPPVKAEAPVVPDVPAKPSPAKPPRTRAKAATKDAPASAPEVTATAPGDAPKPRAKKAAGDTAAKPKARSARMARPKNPPEA
ncbi:MucR family transcriptional regulator [Novosphingobium sp. P6W]|uniref:MucR family transcriptional regulator n=1 Tax=Novosphingobium sp. P6W TaxID=1609758 RepID=UPI0009E2D9D9|nr:MucR family transcriptional regulator [Novosphingobium sp. P6W]AXB79703.1 transcriptional regulator [Novosphingobium sp. P6W]